MQNTKVTYKDIGKTFVHAFLYSPTNSDGSVTLSPLMSNAMCDMISAMLESLLDESTITVNVDTEIKLPDSLVEPAQTAEPALMTLNEIRARIAIIRNGDTWIEKKITTLFSLCDEYQRIEKSLDASKAKHERSNPADTRGYNLELIRSFISNRLK